MSWGYPWRYYKGATSKNFEEYIDGYYLYWQRLVDNKQLKRFSSPSGKVFLMFGLEIFLKMYS